MKPLKWTPAECRHRYEQGVAGAKHTIEKHIRAGDHEAADRWRQVLAEMQVARARKPAGLRRKRPLQD